jgi:phosphoserine phosphatase RsbU/P
MAQILMNRFFDLHTEVAELNVNLEKKVVERTEELQAAMEELEAMNDRLVQTNHSLEDAQRIASIDMAMAADVQASLFPKQPPVSDEWDVAFAYKPLAGVSGDLYDFYMIEGRLRGISLFDVTGHGVSAGLLTLLSKSILGRNVIGLNASGLGAIVEKVNADLRSELSNVDHFLSGIVLRFMDDTVEYVNAGHPDLLIKRAGRGVFPVKPADREMRGSILGLEAISGGFDVVKFRMAQGDVLLLYTDGLDESMNTAREHFGVQRIMRAFDEAPAGSAREALVFILDQFYTYIGGQAPQDDLTAIVVKRIK